MEKLWENNIDKVIGILDNCIECPESFGSPQPDQAGKFKQFAKFLYSIEIKSEINRRITPKGVSKLLIKDFDEEGIWQQLELRNLAAIKYFKQTIDSGHATDVEPDDDKVEAPAEPVPSDASDVESHGDQAYAFDDDEEDDDDDSENDIYDPSKPSVKLDKKDVPKSLPQKRKGESEVDDKFFKLSRMEEFLHLEDLKEARDDSAVLSDNSDDIDLFEDIPSDDDMATSGDEDDDDDKNVNEASGDDGSDDDAASDDGEAFGLKKANKELMYSDFFDPPDSNDEMTGEMMDLDDPDNSDSERIGQSKYDTRDYHPDSSESDLENDAAAADMMQALEDRDDKKKETPSGPITPFERQQEQELKKIKQMETNMLKPKPWQLTGEVAASSRPEDSLVNQEMTFDSNAKQDLLSTDDLTSRVEGIVLGVILNKAWSDVERKVKPKEDPRPYKKPFEVDHAKSKKGLAEVYEEEYLKLHDKSDRDEEDPKHAAIKKMMGDLLPELHALFAHIPKPPVPEIKVVSNLPAITIEEVAPVAISDAALLAPEEIKKRQKGDMKGETERTATDRKRERRKKKVHQKLRQKKIDEKMAEMSTTSSAMAQKHEKLVALKKLKQSRNAQFVNNDGEKIKSSKDFFSRLQDTVQTSKKNEKHHKKQKTSKLK